MLRIGVAASKMSKGSLLRYNLYVILIACLFSLFVFFICAFSILLIIFLVSLILHAFKAVDFHTGWVHVFRICLAILALVVGFFNVVAVLRNIQFTKNKMGF
jgi:uncharacterized BrkB/YihY/UPF0761 family membrane protein